MRTKLPVTNNVLTAFATLMLLRADSFPRNRPTWNIKKVEDQTWPVWKDFFRPLQLALECEQLVATDQPNTFGTVVAAQCYHRIDAVRTARTHRANQGDPTT